MNHDDPPANSLAQRYDWVHAGDDLTLSAGSRQAYAEVEDPLRPIVYRRRIAWPIGLFLLTVLSTFVAGATHWAPHELLFIEDPLPLRRALLANWADGLLYAACILGMLMSHEMGHFLATVFYRIPASFPYFLPLPITPIGTLGAVIRMDSRDADRRQMFDIGIAGPLAGLVIAIPLLIIGIQRIDMNAADAGPFKLDLPLAVRWLILWIRPQLQTLDLISISKVNPYFMAGWVGMLVTALNMLPVGQLDGGHITYTLFGRWAHVVARVFMVAGIAYMVATNSYQMSLMAALILLTGVDHPPTSNDSQSLGWFRYVLGCLSLTLTILCLSPKAIVTN